MTKGLALALALLAGCRFVDRRTVDNPGRNEIIRVESGDRLYFDLEDDPVAGMLWNCRSDDRDVEVAVERREPGKARVCVRVHRGFVGPATLRFVCRKDGGPEGPGAFTVALFRRADATAFWK